MAKSVKNDFNLGSARDLMDELILEIANLRTELTAAVVDLADFKAIYDAHVHTADGNASRTSAPDSGSATGSPSAASEFTVTATAPSAATVSS